MTLYLGDIHALVRSFGLVEDGHCYMGKLDAKKEKSIGVYNLKRASPYRTAIGGRENRSYGVKQVSILVHWDRSPRDTEKAASALFERLEGVRDVNVNGKRILFTTILTGEPVDVGTDDGGIYEMVIEARFYYERGGEDGEDESDDGPAKVRGGPDGGLPVL